MRLNAQNIDVAALLGSVHWYTQLSPDLQRALLNNTQTLEYNRNNWICGAGDQPTGIYIVLTGAVKVYVALPRGDDSLVHVAMPGQIFGHAAGLGQGPRLATVIAAEPSVLMHLPDTTLNQLAATYPEIWSSLARLLYRQVGAMLQHIAYLQSASTQARLAVQLLQLGFPNGSLQAVTLSQAELAELIGVTRKTVNGLLRELQADGLIAIRGRRIDLQDPQELRKIAREMSSDAR